MPWVSAFGSDFVSDYGCAFRREQVRAPGFQSADSVSAGWSVFAMRDAAPYNTYRVYPHSRIITPLFSGTRAAANRLSPASSQSHRHCTL